MTSPNLTPWEILKTQLYLDSQDDSPQPATSNPLPSSLLLPPTLPLKQTNFSKRPLLLQLPTSIKDSISLRRKRRSLQDDSTRQKRLSSKKLILPQIQIKYPISKQITTEVVGSQRISKKKLEVVEVGEYILTGGDQEGRERGRERLEVKEEGKPKRASSHLGIHNLRYFSSCKVRAEEVLYDGGGEKKNGGRMEGEGMGMGDKMQSVSIKFEGKEDLIGMKRVYSTKKIKHHFLDSLLERMH